MDGTSADVDRYPDDADNPLLLVPGYMDAPTLPFTDVSTPHWRQLKDALQERGYGGPIHEVDFGLLGTTVSSPRRYADTLTAEAKTVSERYDRPVNLINWSMGGLGARWAAEKEGAAQYIDTLVTLGTPHKGTSAAVLGLLSSGGRAMLPGSTFLEELNGDGLADSVDYVAVYGTADMAFAGDAERAALPQADTHDNATNIKLEGCSHLDLLRDDAVLDAYYEYLTNSEE